MLLTARRQRRVLRVQWHRCLGLIEFSGVQDRYWLCTYGSEEAIANKPIADTLAWSVFRKLGEFLRLGLHEILSGKTYPWFVLRDDGRVVARISREPLVGFRDYFKTSIVEEETLGDG